MKRTAEELATVLRALVVDFGNRDLGLLGVARAANSFANWAFAIGLGVYAFEIGGAVAVGVIGLVRLAPGAIASPFAGILVDRHPRRSVLVGGGLGTTLLLAAAGAAAALDAPAAAIFVLAGAFTVVISGYVPAEAALLPALARTPQELSAANVTFSTMDNAGFLLAAACTGVTLAVASPEAVFLVAALGALLNTSLVAGITPDRRPAYVREDELSGVLRQTTLGFRTLAEHRGLLLLAATLTLLVFFEGTADVLVVIMALDLLGLDEGSVGFLNAAWGIGALLGAAGLTLLLRRGRLAVALAAGSIALGGAVALPGTWPVPLAAYAGWVGIGIGYTFIEVAAKTLLQRLGSDETLGRALGSLESARLAAMAVGSISAAALVALMGTRGALLALGALMPVFVALCWARLRAYEIGAPVAEASFRLLRENPIFAPLPVATLERLSHDLTPVGARSGEEVITQGDHGDSFYLIEEGEVEVFEDGAFRRREGPGESFGEIALLRDVPRTATVRATVPTRLLRLGRDQFITAVTGHRRSGEAAQALVDARWGTSVRS
ncbi:MAG TPA: MFS transporter [Solirubrobacterales bacterium]